jgi:hypothetical protein
MAQNALARRSLPTLGPTVWLPRSSMVTPGRLAWMAACTRATGSPSVRNRMMYSFWLPPVSCWISAARCAASSALRSWSACTGWLVRICSIVPPVKSTL